MNENQRLPIMENTFHYYTIYVGGDNDHFYPCTWVSSTTAYISIHSPSAMGSYPYNQNEITFLASLQGWSDMPKRLLVLEHGMYSYDEITIHSIYYGNENGNNCVYLRGDMEYRIWSNATITPNVTGFKGGNEQYGIMDSSYNVTTSTVTRAWTYEDGSEVAIAKRGAAIALADAGAPLVNTIKLAYSGDTLQPSQVTHILAYDNRESGTAKLARDFTIDNLKTRLGSIPANGGNATSIGDDTMKVYAERANEVNFGGSNNSGVIYFGYRAKDSKPIPTEFIFGGSTGTATVKAANFLLNGKQVATTDQIPTVLPGSLLMVRDLRDTTIYPSYGSTSIIGWFNHLGTPSGNWWSGIHVKGWSSDYATWQLAGPSDNVAPASDALWFRSGKDSSWNGWKRVAFINEVVTLSTNQTISGAKTFTSYAIFTAGSGTSSDIRLKENIKEMSDAEDILSNLSGYRYTLKDTQKEYAGLIAQEVQEVLPEAVREDEDGFLTVDTYPIVAALVEANKAKDRKISELENRLNIMEEKMNIILSKLEK